MKNIKYNIHEWTFSINIKEYFSGNCNSDDSDDQILMNGERTSSVQEFGLSWQVCDISALNLLKLTLFCIRM